MTLLVAGCNSVPEEAVPLDNVELKISGKTNFHIRSLRLLNDDGKWLLDGRVISLSKFHGPSAFANHLDVTLFDEAGDVLDVVYVRLPVRVKKFDHRFEADADQISEVNVEYHNVREGHI